MEINESVSIAVPVQQTWNFLWDIERMMACIPGCERVHTVAKGQRYEAEVGQKVGPFKVRFPLDIAIKEQQPPWRLSATATGQDAKISSNVNVDLEVLLSEGTSQSTQLALHADIHILGKLATLGQGMVKRKAKQVVAQFAANIKLKLEEGERIASL